MTYLEWLEELDREERAHRPYRDRAKKIEDRYRLEESESAYNIFWANVQILSSALYSNTPKPDVQRRFKKNSNDARDAAILIERALSFSVDSYDFDDRIEAAVNNYLVPGIGQVRVNYTPYFGQGEPLRVDLDIQTDLDGNRTAYRGEKKVDDFLEDEMGPYIEEPQEVIEYQQVDCSTVPWSCFRWSPAKDWDTVWWVGEEHYLTKDEVERTFVIRSDENIPLGYTHDKKEKGEGQYAKIVEVWDKRTRTHFGVVEGIERLLKFRAGDSEAEDDPLNLSGFWPYPKPIAANVTAGMFVPIPDYRYYQRQAMEMDRLTRRLEKLVDNLKYRGVYDGTFEELANIMGADDGNFKPVENFAARFQNGGLDAVIAAMPLRDLLAVVQWLVQAREEVKQTIFEITGISDIVRGATKATETLGAQQLKGQFANMRLSKRQNAVKQFVREIMRIKAEIIAEHFEDDVLELMTGIQVTPAIRSILSSDVLRAFNVDIETDSTVISDQAVEQEQRTAVVESVTNLVSAWAPLIQGAPQLLDIVKELIMFQLSAFKVGRQLEDAFEKLSDGAAPAIPQMGGEPIEAGSAPPGNNVVPL